VLVEAGLRQSERQPGPPDLRNGNLAEQVRERADVILVRVREDDGTYAVLPLDQVAEVGKDQVDPEVLVPGKGEARVDDDDVVAELVDHQVLPHLAEAAERDDPKGVRRHEGDSNRRPRGHSPVQGMRRGRRSSGICPCCLRSPWAPLRSSLRP
jgi:hypothetical protein